MLKKIFYCIFSGLFIIIGLIGAMVGLMSIVDPIGTKMADDSLPFASPSHASKNILITAIFIVIFVFGLYLLFCQSGKKYKIAKNML